MLSVKDFVKQVVQDIETAKKEEESILGVRGVIDFDIATVADETGVAGIKVAVFGFGGDFGGQLSNQITSRVQFSIQTRGAISPGGVNWEGKK
jgi:hypothetical protein